MNTLTPVQKFESWAVIELFGHQQMAGLVTEQTFGPATFFKVSVPETPTQPAFDRLVNPSSIYAINPVTEEVAKARAAQIEFKPIQAYDVRKMLEKQATDETPQRRIEEFVHCKEDDDEDEDDLRF